MDGQLKVSITDQQCNFHHQIPWISCCWLLSGTQAADPQGAWPKLLPSIYAAVNFIPQIMLASGSSGCSHCWFIVSMKLQNCCRIDPLQTRLFPLLAYSNSCYPPCWGTYTSTTARVSTRMVGFLPGYFASLWSEASKERLYNDCSERLLLYWKTTTNSLTDRLG